MDKSYLQHVNKSVFGIDDLSHRKGQPEVQYTVYVMVITGGQSSNINGLNLLRMSCNGVEAFLYCQLEGAVGDETVTLARQQSTDIFFLVR